jgi:hypothetical protein
LSLAYSTLAGGRHGVKQNDEGDGGEAQSTPATNSHIFPFLKPLVSSDETQTILWGKAGRHNTGLVLVKLQKVTRLPVVIH